MMSTAKNSSVYRSAINHLIQLGQMAAEAGCWQEPTPAQSVGSVHFHVQLLVSAILGVDGSFSWDEHEFVNAIYGVADSYDVNLEYVEAMMHGSYASLLRGPPEFFVGLLKLDRARGTTSSLRAFQVLNVIALGAVAADNNYDERELDFFNDYIRMLGASIVNAGIAGQADIAVASADVPDLVDLLAAPSNTWIRAARAFDNDDVVESEPRQETAVTQHDTDTNALGGQKRARRDLTSLMTELTDLVGLGPVKQEVASMTNQIRVRQMRTARGLSVPHTSNHAVFYGSPGTGKTTVARILAGIYRELGVLPNGHLVETDRSGLVASYVGQTAIKVQEIVKKAMGGVLFIDEAYSLISNRGEQDYGREAVDVLLKLMEDNRDDLIVIVAGYDEKMAEFLEANPGLKSRFNKFIRFPDYSPDELVEIFRRMVRQNEYVLSAGAEEKVAKLLADVYVDRNADFGNARLARNLFEQILAHQANRIAEEALVSDEALSLIMPTDIPSAPVLH